MPYIAPGERTLIQDAAPALHVETAGHLNYKITDLIDSYIQQQGGVNYTNINEVIGVLECAKLELYRRVAAPYEDDKCDQNGDVYECLNEDEA